MSTSVDSPTSTSLEGELKETLKELDRRLRARRRELRHLGRFTASHDVMVADIRARQAEILRRLSAELSRGTSWTLIKTEWALEFSGLVSTLLSWQERLDGETLKDGGGDQRIV
jgi:hypothetical protein